MDTKTQTTPQLVLLIFIVSALGIAMLQPFRTIGSSIGPGWSDALNGGIALVLLGVGAVIVLVMRAWQR